MPLRVEGDWRRDGYVVVRGLFSADRVAQLRHIAEHCITQWKECNPENGQPTANAKNATCMRHLNHPGYFPPRSQVFVALMESIADPDLLSLVEDCLGMPPLFRSTSLFVNPLDSSTDGSWHRDQQFLIPGEADEEQFLKEQVASGLTHAHGMQMQIALVPNEDVELVKGSHLRWDLPEEYAVRCAGGRSHSTEDMPGATRIALEPGDAVCFNSNGFHRGRYHVDRPRRTLMFTYTGLGFDTFDYFSDQKWFLQPEYLQGLSPGATAFFQRFVDTFHGRIADRQEQVTAAAKAGAARQEKEKAVPYTRYLQQAREQMVQMGFDAGVLAKL